jgi:hypothetical protein
MKSNTIAPSEFPFLQPHIFVPLRQSFCHYRLSHLYIFPSPFLKMFPLRNFRLPLRCKWDLHSFGILRSVDWWWGLELLDVWGRERHVAPKDAIIPRSAKTPKQRRSQANPLLSGTNLRHINVFIPSKTQLSSVNDKVIGWLQGDMFQLYNSRNMSPCI